MPARLIQAAALFGLAAQDPPRPAATAWARTAARLDAALKPGQIALLRGPSGSGKSATARALAARLTRRRALCLRVDPPALLRRAPATPLIDLLPGSLQSALRTLARAGLGDATLLALPPRALSDGQRWRLALALAMHRAQHARRPATLIADEFASILDRATARSLAASLRRWCDHAPTCRIVCATAHDDLAHALAPDLTLRCDPGADAQLTPASAPARRARRAPLRLRVEPGVIADYDRLARFHYRAGRPATHVRVLRAVAGSGPRRQLAGVLVVSMPTLNGPWRDLAWPGRFDGCRRAAAARLASELRTISRVVVDPRLRACGVASRLVRAYLCRPLTPATEAIAAMGACCPLFARAGMTEYRLPPTRRDARLADALAACRADPPDLLHPRRRAALLRRPLLARELRRWAAAAGATRPLARGPLPALARRAALALCAARIAYAHARPPARPRAPRGRIAATPTRRRRPPTHPERRSCRPRAAH